MCLSMRKPETMPHTFLQTAFRNIWQSRAKCNRINARIEIIRTLRTIKPNVIILRALVGNLFYRSLKWQPSAYSRGSSLI